MQGENAEVHLPKAPGMGTEQAPITLPFHYSSPMNSDIQSGVPAPLTHGKSLVGERMQRAQYLYAKFPLFPDTVTSQISNDMTN